MKNKQAMSLKELNAETGYPKSTLHDLLATMLDHDVIAQDETGKYFLGDMLFEYGQAVFMSWNIIQQMHEYLEDLAHRTGLNVALAVVRKNHLVNVNFRIEKESGIKDSSFVGIQKPFHASSQGKVFLASYDDRKIMRIIRKEGMSSYTENTITDFEALMEEIELVRRNGYAIGNSEFTKNRKAISVPLKNKAGKVVYALAVLGKSEQIPDENVPQIAVALKEEAVKISEKLEI